MTTVTMKQLLEGGVHFGHQSRRWNPKMAKYIYTERNGIYIIDLKKTLRLLREAFKFVRDSVALGKTVMFVGTKKQAKDTIKDSANSCGMYYVNNRWLGGMLTNFQTVRKSVNRLIELEQKEADGSINLYSKKEAAQLMREKTALLKNLEGVKNMTALPGILFVVDPHREQIAIKEAQKLKIPIVSIVDTNCDPDPITYVIPGNDDAIRAIKLFADQVALAVSEGTRARNASIETGEPPEKFLTDDTSLFGGEAPEAEKVENIEESTDTAQEETKANE